MENTLNYSHTGATNMNKERMDILYSVNSIRREKCELYGDYLHSLFSIIFDTYMGDDVTNHSERINHFKWCWNKNVTNFKEEGYDINSEELFNYFLEFTLNVYYASSSKTTNHLTTLNILKLWSFLFDYMSDKPESDLKTFLNVYNLFEKSLNN